MREVGVLRDFYITYFGAKAMSFYHIKKTGVKSYFLSFDEETRLKLMGHSRYRRIKAKDDFVYAQLAMSVGIKERVDDLTNRLSQAGFESRRETMYNW